MYDGRSEEGTRLPRFRRISPYCILACRLPADVHAHHQFTRLLPNKLVTHGFLSTIPAPTPDIRRVPTFSTTRPSALTHSVRSRHKRRLHTTHNVNTTDRDRDTTYPTTIVLAGKAACHSFQSTTRLSFLRLNQTSSNFREPLLSLARFHHDAYRHYWFASCALPTIVDIVHSDKHTISYRAYQQVQDRRAKTSGGAQEELAFLHFSNVRPWKCCTAEAKRDNHCTTTTRLTDQALCQEQCISFYTFTRSEGHTVAPRVYGLA